MDEKTAAMFEHGEPPGESEPDPPPLLECCRDATGPERRHLRVMGADQPLCGTVARQDGAGAGTFSGLLAWPTCAKCHAAAERLGPHPEQADDAPRRMRLTDLLSGGDR